MKPFFLVALGGAFGSVCRYKMGAALAGHFPGALLPVTLFINLLGCFLIGILAALGERRGVLTPEARLFLMTGTLGGFTTFSTFGLETFGFLREQKLGLALIYAGLSVVGGVLGVALGWRVAS